MMGAKNYIMKAFTLTLKQVNKSGNDSFKAVKTFEIEGGKQVAMEKIATDSAEFCKDIIALKKRSEERGNKSSLSGIKKSLPMQIIIGGTNVKLSYRNFSKFAEQASKKLIAEDLLDNFKFIDKHDSYDRA
jgi:hypothetical protein